MTRVAIEKEEKEEEEKQRKEERRAKNSKVIFICASTQYLSNKSRYHLPFCQQESRSDLSLLCRVPGDSPATHTRT